MVLGGEGGGGTKYGGGFVFQRGGFGNAMRWSYLHKERTWMGLRFRCYGTRLTDARKSVLS